jgi:predicted DNA binding CopG/RHH family protein
MSASKQLKILSVRLPEQEVRTFKSIAAQRGVSLQEAVHEALASLSS